MSENYIVINGKKAELTNEQMELLGIKLRKNPFERVSKNDSYYNISNKARVMHYTEKDDEVDQGLYNAVNYFNDFQFANQVALHQLLYRKLLKFAYDNGCEDVAEWDGNNGHWSIRYSVNHNRFFIYSSWLYKTQDVYFSSEESARSAIKQVAEPFMKEHPEFVW